MAEALLPLQIKSFERHKPIAPPSDLGLMGAKARREGPCFNVSSNLAIGLIADPTGHGLTATEAKYR
jgi:hypothetical protein